MTEHFKRGQGPSDDDFLAELTSPFTRAAGAEARRLISQLERHTRDSFRPQDEKSLRRFSAKEAAKFLRMSEGDLKAVLLDPEVAKIERIAGRLAFTFDDIRAIRAWMISANPAAAVRKRPGDRTQIISVANFKGGSAKTTTAIHLAQHLTLRGYRTLAIDMDPQGSLTSCFGLRPSIDVTSNATMMAAMDFDETRRQNILDIIRPTYMPGLDLVPASPALQSFQIEVAKAMGDQKNRFRQAEGLQFHFRMRGCLAPVVDAEEGAYDVIVIDCPPQIDFLTTCAVICSTGILVPFHPQMIDLESYVQFITMLASLEDLPDFADEGGRWRRLLFTRYNSGERGQNDVYNFLKQKLAWKALPNPMVNSAAIAEAGYNHVTLYELAPPSDSRAAYMRAVEAMDLVNNDIEDLIRRTWDVLRGASSQRPIVEAA